MVSWSTLQTLLLLLGPYLYTKSKSLYLSTRISLPPLPTPPSTQTVLNLLFLSALLFLTSTLPYFAPENIFTATASRLQTPTDVLFTRLSTHRDPTAHDAALRQRLTSREGRLLYAAYGPGVVGGCEWCVLDEPRTWLAYALPSLAWPHLAHLLVLGLATSRVFGRFGALWRTPAALAGVLLLAGEIWAVAFRGADAAANRGARSAAEVVWTHWRVRVWRGAGVAAVDAAVAGAVWASATRRWRYGWEGAEVEGMLEALRAVVERAGGRMRAAGVLRQTVLGDERLRGRMVGFWEREEAVGREVGEVAEVREAREGAEGRVGVNRVRREAHAAAKAFMKMAGKEVVEEEEGEGEKA
ncbi:hypothetical protein EDC01DRAFT_750746 [Geopyxis carbonaria]|nr:hypothetical protein EDC01DRAFT_750746 [Geopyxis carbonaria]